MISIKPKWCELIANGQKTIEVRKTKPKVKPPFKCYIYCTKASKRKQTVSGCMVLNSDELFRHPKQGIKHDTSVELMLCDPNEYNEDNFLNGKVIGEFVCDGFYTMKHCGYDNRDVKLRLVDEDLHYLEIDSDFLNECRLSYYDIEKYSNGRDVYGWHISDLVIYDRPKDLVEFTPYCKYLNDNGSCQYEKIECDCAKTDFNSDYSVNMVECLNYMTKPPQSWCYVEEVGA